MKRTPLDLQRRMLRVPVGCADFAKVAGADESGSASLSKVGGALYRDRRSGFLNDTPIKNSAARRSLVP